MDIISFFWQLFDFVIPAFGDIADFVVKNWDWILGAGGLYAVAKAIL
jgi:hypothetical protein